MTTMRRLNTHETEVCEGIIRYLERREGVERSEVRGREGNDTPPDARVEMTFRLGEQLFAIEHTVLEPFEGFLAHQNRSPQLFHPLSASLATALADLLQPGVIIELSIPIDAFDGYELRAIRALQTTMVEYVKTTAPTLPVGRHYRGKLVTAQPAGLPFVVSLVRFDGFRDMPGQVQLKHKTDPTDEARVPRLQRACDDKFPKLDWWKRSDHARTILAFEQNDVQLTNTPIVAATFLPIARRDDVPDETYLVSTCTSPWYAWPILVSGRTYFQIAQTSRPVHFEMDATGHLIDA
jgi:hypothetical protein